MRGCDTMCVLLWGDTSSVHTAWLQQVHVLVAHSNLCDASCVRARKVGAGWAWRTSQRCNRANGLHKLSKRASHAQTEQTSCMAIGLMGCPLMIIRLLGRCNSNRKESWGETGGIGVQGVARSLAALANASKVRQPRDGMGLADAACCVIKGRLLLAHVSRRMHEHEHEHEHVPMAAAQLVPVQTRESARVRSLSSVAHCK